MRRYGKPIKIRVNGVVVGTCQTTIMDEWDTTTDIELLKAILDRAIMNEEYEDAAQIRDVINRLTK